jgi:DNA polymerase III epsilon subunit-like protein
MACKKHIHGSVAKLAIVDVETTGLDPVQNELIALSLICVEVDRDTGELMKVLDSYTGQREPTLPMSLAIEQLVGE